MGGAVLRVDFEVIRTSDEVESGNRPTRFHMEMPWLPSRDDLVMRHDLTGPVYRVNHISHFTDRLWDGEPEGRKDLANRLYAGAYIYLEVAG